MYLHAVTKKVSTSTFGVKPQLLPSWIIVGTQFNRPVFWTGAQWTDIGKSYGKCFVSYADAVKELAQVTYGGAFRYLSPGILKTTCMR